MKKILFICCIVAIVIGITSGCSKKKGCRDPISINYDPDAEEDDGSCEYAGLGGNTTIVASPEHHGVPIVSDSTYLDTAYVKFNTTESPGISPGSYDAIFVGEAGENHVHLTGLKRGKYYIMMAGLDTSGTGPPFRVFGGIPHVLTQSSGEVPLHIPVTE